MLRKTCVRVPPVPVTGGAAAAADDDDDDNIIRLRVTGGSISTNETKQHASTHRVLLFCIRS